MGLWLAKNVIRENPVQNKKPIHIFYKNELYLLKATDKPMPISHLTLDYRAAENVLRCSYLNDVNVVFTMSGNILNIDIYKQQGTVQKKRHIKEYPWSDSFIHIEIEDMQHTEMRNPASYLSLSRFNLR